MKKITEVVIVGGGTAGWLTAAVIASHHNVKQHKNLVVTLVESDIVPTVGVGEGTWPTMKNTIQKIGLSERDVLKHCQATFKQGGKFVGWSTGQPGDAYHHPFTVPLGYERLDVAPYLSDITDFADAANFQQAVCEAGLSPKTFTDAQFNAQLNYAYHLDAGAFADLLRTHCIDTLGINHVINTVETVQTNSQGDIEQLNFVNGECLTGDLFVDCTGAPAVLIGKTLGVEKVSTKDVLFNNRAIAVQLPYPNEQDDIASYTIATAQQVGWVWDIGLQTRRGVGYVYSSDYINDDDAKNVLINYIKASKPNQDLTNIKFKNLKFESGYRKEIWKNNCVAVGMSAGFVEPLEATAIMLIEQSAKYIAENMPADTEIMALTAQRFNKKMNYRWQRIIDFLKLHYSLTTRPEPYWQDNCKASTIPVSLKEDLALWRYRGPLSEDFDSAIELFPAASYQYVLFGMGFQPDYQKMSHLYGQHEQASAIFKRNETIKASLLNSLPSHREYFNALS